VSCFVSCLLLLFFLCVVGFFFFFFFFARRRQKLIKERMYTSQVLVTVKQRHTACEANEKRNDQKHHPQTEGRHVQSTLRGKTGPSRPAPRARCDTRLPLRVQNISGYYLKCLKRSTQYSEHMSISVSLNLDHGRSSSTCIHESS